MPAESFSFSIPTWLPKRCQIRRGPHDNSRERPGGGNPKQVDKSCSALEDSHVSLYLLTNNGVALASVLQGDVGQANVGSLLRKGSTRRTVSSVLLDSILYNSHEVDGHVSLSARFVDASVVVGRIITCRAWDMLPGLSGCMRCNTKLSFFYYSNYRVHSRRLEGSCRHKVHHNVSH